MGTALWLDPVSSLEVVPAGSAVAGSAVAGSAVAGSTVAGVSIFVGMTGLVVDRAPTATGGAVLLAELAVVGAGSSSCEH